MFVHSVANLQSTYANNVVLRLTYPKYLGLKETTGQSVDKVEPFELGKEEEITEEAVDKAEGTVDKAESDQLEKGNVDEGSQPAKEEEKKEEDPEALMQLTLNLSTLQYGQSRDIFLSYDRKAQEAITDGFEFESPPSVLATLDYQHFTNITHTIVSECEDIFRVPNPLVKQPLTPAQIAYHISRSALIAFLSSLYPLRRDGEHQPLAHTRKLATSLQSLLTTLPAAQPTFVSDPHCRSLVQDLIGTTDPSSFIAHNPTITPKDGQNQDQDGQVALALTNTSFYNKWGIHYLPSLAAAHERQVCNSFKDPGPLMYGTNSPLFVRCRDRLDAAFDSLPAPKPSRKIEGFKGEISMRSYNSSANPCFGGESKVRVRIGGSGDEEEGTGGLVEGSESEKKKWKEAEIEIRTLRKGMLVQTPKGFRKVRAVLKTAVEDERMCLVGSRLLVTPWHPISLDENGKDWVFPMDLVAHGEDTVSYTGYIYSVLLENDPDADGHAIMVEGVWGVTLGHGLTGMGEGEGVVMGDGDVRTHRFFGDYDLVVQSLAKLQCNQDGVLMGGGVTRDARTGLVNGFKRRSEHVPSGTATSTREELLARAVVMVC